MIFATDPSSETQGQSVRSGERCDKSYQGRAEEVSDCSWVSQNGSIMVHESSQITI